MTLWMSFPRNCQTLSKTMPPLAIKMTNDGVSKIERKGMATAKQCGTRSIPNQFPNNQSFMETQKMIIY